MAPPHCTLVQIRSGPDVILSASVLLDMVQVHAGVVRVERSRTSVMSRPAIGCGTDGVIAMSSAAHGPEGSTTGLGSVVGCFVFPCSPGVCVGVVGPVVEPWVEPVAGPVVEGVVD